MKWLGLKIKEIAKKKGIKLKDLAAQIGITRQTVNDWVNGQIPKGYHLVALCKILQSEPNEFFSSDSKNYISIPIHRTRN